MPEIPLPITIDLAIANYGTALHQLGRYTSDWRRRRANDSAERARAEIRAHVGSLVGACQLIEKCFDLPDKTGFTPEQAYALGAVKGALLAVHGKVAEPRE